MHNSYNRVNSRKSTNPMISQRIDDDDDDNIGEGTEHAEHAEHAVHAEHTDHVANDDSESDYAALSEEIHHSIRTLQDEEYANSYSYPATIDMSTDVDNYADGLSYVNIHICPFQIRKSTNNTPFLQYFMKRYTPLHNEKDVGPDQDQDRVQGTDTSTSNKYSEAPYLDFQCKTIFDTKSTNVGILTEATNMMKIMLAHYNVFLLKEEMYAYVGFIEKGNDVYVFFDVTKSWVNHHFLSINDPIWLVNVYEISVMGEVGPYRVSNNVSNLFKQHRELLHLVDKGENRISLPVIGYTVEQQSRMDFVMMFGTRNTTESTESTESVKSVNKNDGGSSGNVVKHEMFYYDYSYDACVDRIKDMYTPDDYIIVRHAIFFDVAVEYDEVKDYVHYKNGTIVDVAQDTLLLLPTKNTRQIDGFICLRHGNQTPLTCHDFK